MICLRLFCQTLTSVAANFGFSIGINDVTPGPLLRSEKQRLVEKAYAECQVLIVKARAGTLQNKPGCNTDQTLEAMISDVLSDVRGQVGKICMKELSRHNAPWTMATCGSKGLRNFPSPGSPANAPPFRFRRQRGADGGMCGTADYRRSTCSRRLPRPLASPLREEV